MAKVIWKPSVLTAPVPPVMVSCGTMERANILTIAWTGTLNTVPAKTYISVRPERYSYEIIKNTGEFVINLTTRELVRAADFCGARTGKKIDKFAKLKLTKAPASVVKAPLISQSPINLECRVTDIVPMGTHDMFIADIVAVDIDEDKIDKSGKLRMDLCNLVAYAHGDYYLLGKKLGSFGFSVKKKKTTRKK